VSNSQWLQQLDRLCAALRSLATTTLRVLEQRLSSMASLTEVDHLSLVAVKSALLMRVCAAAVRS
jgi:hypothetical protein